MLRSPQGLPVVGFIFSFLLMLSMWAPPAKAADREELEAFLEVTGFDVALESIRLSADSAPAMLGIEANDFGSEWQRLVREVFDTSVMHEMAVDILAETLSDDLLGHAASFYASDLGQRLVAVENKSHMVEDEALKSQTGEDILAGLKRIDSERPGLLQRLNAASNTENTSVQAIQEVQVRFMMAAAAAGVIELRMEEPDLREALRAQEGELRSAISQGALVNAAYTYQAFSDAEVTTYAEELEHPKMRDVYALMNAVQFEVMANRYEAVAERLAGMQPSQEL
jgi:hypothetical protein